MQFKLSHNPRGLRVSLISLTILLFWGSLSLSYSQEPAQLKSKKEDYNVVLIIIDTLRADHLGCYGYPQDTSPTIDRIAQDSMLFENAFSNAGYTLPSVMSIFTSLYPSSHGMFRSHHKDKLSPGVQTMAEMFQDYNYQTAWFSLLRIDHLDIDIGFGRGFQDKVELSLKFEGRQELLSWLDKQQKHKFFLAMDARQVNDFLFLQQSKALKGIATQDAQEMYAEANKVEESFYAKLIELAQSGKPPFDDPKFMAKHAELFNGVYFREKIGQIRELVDPAKRQLLDDLSFNFDRSLMAKIARKNSFNDSKLLNGIYAGGKIGQIEDLSGSGKRQQPVDRSLMAKIAREHPQAYIAAYDAAIQTVDTELVKPIYEKLKALGVYDQTIIIITADHGEAFGEHGYYTHSRIYPEITHVPFIIKMPDSKGGKKRKELVQSIDILPTVLELVGIEEPRQIQGRSLVGLLTGKDTLGPNKYVFAESQNRKSLRSKEWSLVLPDYDNAQYGPKELYHLTVDPQEHKNVYSLEPQVAAKLEKELRQWEAALPVYQDQEHPFDPGIDQAAQERIRRAGYF